MSQREIELRETALHGQQGEAIQATVDLVNEFLSPAGSFVEAEQLLMEKIGLQTLREGHILELTLGELYIAMKEISRARRFLEVAKASGIESITQRAGEQLANLE
jgi:hypothetical protein